MTGMNKLLQWKGRSDPVCWDTLSHLKIGLCISFVCRNERGIFGLTLMQMGAELRQERHPESRISGSYKWKRLHLDRRIVREWPCEIQDTMAESEVHPGSWMTIQENEEGFLLQRLALKLAQCLEKDIGYAWSWWGLQAILWRFLGISVCRFIVLTSHFIDTQDFYIWWCSTGRKSSYSGLGAAFCLPRMPQRITTELHT